LNWPVEMQLQVTPEQFEVLALANRTMQLEHVSADLSRFCSGTAIRFR
jgi:hypothetical protein